MKIVIIAVNFIISLYHLFAFHFPLILYVSIDNLRLPHYNLADLNKLLKLVRDYYNGGMLKNK